jgi:N-acetylglucosamine-6-phosphate deacetylase
MIALIAKTLYTPLDRVENPLLLLEGQHIVEVTSQTARAVPAGARLVDFGDAVLAPGLLDIHIHGGAGYDVMQTHPSALSAVEHLIAKHGVTGYFPTTVTAPIDKILSALERLATAIEESGSRDPAEGSLRATPLGIHLEGPFMSHARSGVHPPEDLLLPTLALFERFWQAARGHIRIITMAPELEGATELIAEASKRGVRISMGHSDADLKATRAGFAAGARHATHLFNAMRPLRHRDPGIVGEVLTNPQLTADIIADGIHLDPSIVQVILAAKGKESTVLITDAISATGMPDGLYPLGSLQVEVKDGKALYNGHLAGSILTLDLAVRNVMRFAHWDLQQALRTATLNPAWVAGLANRGQLQAGAAADLVVMTQCGEVKNTIIRGHVN